MTHTRVVAPDASAGRHTFAWPQAPEATVAPHARATCDQPTGEMMGAPPADSQAPASTPGVTISVETGVGLIFWQSVVTGELLVGVPLQLLRGSW
jgi:hypothetical protein